MRRRRPYRRATRVLRSRRRARIGRQVHRFSRTCTKLQIQGSIIYTPLLSSFAFRLNDLPNTNEFSNLFDQYRISYVVLKVRLYNTPDAQASGMNQSNYPTLVYATDYDDESTPNSLNEIKERGTCKQRVLRPDRYIRIGIKPKVLIPVYKDGVTNAYQSQYPGKLDMTYNNIPHYGLKWAIDNLSNTNFLVDFQATYYFTCYGTR